MLLHLDFNSDVPIYQQIRNQIVLGIADGGLEPGQRLPTIRALADEAGINMMTVSKAYQLLKQEGYIQTDRRSGATVAPRHGAVGPSRDTLQGLRLRLSELRLAGLERGEILDLCAKLYDEEGEGK